MCSPAETGVKALHFSCLISIAAVKSYKSDTQQYQVEPFQLKQSVELTEIEGQLRPFFDFFFIFLF